MSCFSRETLKNSVLRETTLILNETRRENAQNVKYNKHKDMQTVKIGAHVVRIYNSIEDMPIMRYHKFNKCLLIDAGVGADVAAVDRHLYKARAFMAAQKTALAQAELDNLRQTIILIANNVTPKLTAFAALVAEIDGKKQTDITDEGLQRVSALLQDATVGEVAGAVDSQKKKIDAELKIYFADLFNDEADKEFFDVLKSRMLEVLRGIIDGNPDDGKIERLTRELMQHVKPRIFHGKENAEVRYDKNFEKLCITLSEYTNANVKTLTVSEFYSLFEYAKELAKKQQKQSKKH